VGGLDPRQILDDGRRRAGEGGVSDAPAPAAPGASWIDHLERLTASASEEGGLSPAGAAAFREKLVALVAERLRADALLGAHAEIGARPLPVRFAVAGLARSGTTFLHRLLACDPDVEFLPTWQAFQPVPPASGPDPRRDDAHARIAAIRAADPAALAIHPLDADAPEEEVFLLQHSFASMLFALSCPLPSYSAWLNTTDHTDAYRFAFDLLRANEWYAGTPAGRPRVMKSPQLVLDLAAVTALLPDTVIVQNHRDPVDLVGSYCSTYAGARRRSCTSVDPLQLGRERLAQLQAMAARSLAVRDAADQCGDGDRFIDVAYTRLVAEPLAVVDEVYATAGLTVSPAALAAMEAWLRANAQHQGGRHDYDLADYGLDRARVEAALADYVARFSPEAEA